MTSFLRRGWITATAALAAVFLVLFPARADAHSLDSSTISVHVDGGSADTTVSIALEALEEALGPSYVENDPDTVITYRDQHLIVSGADGTIWSEAGAGPLPGSAWSLTEPSESR